MMRRGLRGRTVATLLAVALLPALVFACAVLVQGTKLSTPSVATVVGKPPAGVSASVWSGVVRNASRSLANVASDQNDALTYGWIGVALAALLGGALAIAVSGRRAWAGVPAQPFESRRPAGTDANTERDRSILVEACIEVSDAVPSASLREELLEALERAGVQAVEVPAGEPFDPKRHRAAGRVPTAAPERENLVAETERPGFVDRGRRLRPPSVLVYHRTRERSV
jgi:hypothetical protein